MDFQSHRPTMVDASLGNGQRIVNQGARFRWWRRIGTPKGGFKYVDADGHPILHAESLERVKHLAIPPGWQDVHISPHGRSRIQALGIGAGGKAQYIYHPSFVERQKRHRFEKIEHFGEHLPRLRQLTTAHLAGDGLGRERVLALVTRLVNTLYFRVGSEAGVRRYSSYGVTTLRNHHLKIRPGGRLEFSFQGKHHVKTHRILVDETIARVLRELKAKSGSRLFKYVNGDGRFKSVSARDVNEYIKSITAPEFSAKDFRTWHGTLIVAMELAKIGKGKSARERKHNVARAVKGAAELLGNTPAVCRRAYLHPMVLSLYERGITLENVPLQGGPIPAQQKGYYAQELQILELFHLGRELQLARRHAKPSPGAPASAPPALVAVTGS